ncbi:putative efflux pump antibiotic resistance protein [Bimuria novae-zelandiae CBS 107.79]|uniref:Putative efflux pump antibiotic resistance protein n=1 Tax=Bimuria novae-zelandiae CBS 107.79 TaxID=1447943 RepID=A0A6A5UTH9_9PLEO|nr:putative efflux pump antibiotic resistance protein [Bimuria novae-zelandiae CBS 107.79]
MAEPGDAKQDDAQPSNVKTDLEELRAPKTVATDVVSECKVKGILWCIVVIAVISPTFLYALDNTIMANVRPSIIDTFGRVDMLTWLCVSYSMGEVGANPLWGKLNDQFDSKILYLLAVLIFEVGSAVIGIYVGTVTIISTMTTPSERTEYLNFVGMAWSLGTVLRPIIGGAFADSSATWRWAFYINICIAAVAVPASVWLVPPITNKSPYSVLHRIKRVDYLGAVLFLGGVVTVIMILGLGGAEYEWKSREMIALYATTVVIWAAFGLQQRFSLFTTDRISSVQLVGDYEMVIMFIWTALAIANCVVTIYSLPLFFQFAHGETALRSASYTLPFVFSFIVIAGATGPLFAKYPIAKIFGYTVIQGISVGPVIQLGYTVAQTKVPRNVVPQVTAFLTWIATAVFLNRTTDDIIEILPGTPRDVIQASINGARTGLLESLYAKDRLRVLYTIARNVGMVFYLNIAGSALGLLTCLAMKREKLKL